MKQQITKEQWEELPIKHQQTFYNSVFTKRKVFEDGVESIEYQNQNHFPNIGEMIEFLGDDLTFIEWNYSPRDIKLVANGKKTLGNEGELCDTLWEAVKAKLNS